MGARERVLALIDGAWTTQAIGAACGFGVFDALADAPRDAGALAGDTGADAASMARLLKALAALGLCEARDDGRFALTPDGECLRGGVPGSLRQWASLSASRLWTNWSSLERCVRTGRSARELRGALDFGELEADATASALFNAAMTDLTRPVADAAAATLDWSGAATIVDVGGGAGALAAGILLRHPHLRGIVCDLGHARGPAESLIASHGLSDRCRFAECDFFASVPEGADAYLLKSVVHNWPDARARGILASCRAAVSSRGRVILVERVAPSRPGTGADARDVARSDLNMLVSCGGRERTEEEFRDLLASCGLALRRVAPVANGFAALEAFAG